MRKTLFWLSTLVLGGTSVRPRKDLKANIISQNNAQRELCRKKQLQFRNQFPDVLLNIAGREVPAKVEVGITQNGAPFEWFVVWNIQSYTLSIFALGCRPDQSRTSQNSKICQTYRICKGKCPKFTYIWYISHLPFPLRAYSKLSSLVLDGTLFDFVSLGAFPLPLYNFSFLIHLFTGAQLMNLGFPRRFPFEK